jgi:hypothetical protein
MVNAINVVGGINFKELQEGNIRLLIESEVKSDAPQSATLSLSQTEFKMPHQIENWRRRNVGTYPKWFANFAKKIVHFIFKRVLRRKIGFIFRGRGSRREYKNYLQLAQDINPYDAVHRLQSDLPIRYAKKVAVYVSIFRKEKHYA